MKPLARSHTKHVAGAQKKQRREKPIVKNRTSTWGRQTTRPDALTSPEGKQDRNVFENIGDRSHADTNANQPPKICAALPGD